MKKISDIIPISKQNIYNLGISFFAVSVFIFVGIIPAYIKNSALEQNISTVRNKLEEHKGLLPLYVSLSMSPKQNADDFVVSEDMRLEKTGLTNILKAIRSVVTNSDMTVLKILPDLDYASKNPQAMSVSLSLTGKYKNLKTVLTGFARLPYIEHIEEISIQQKPNTQTLEIKLKIMLAMN